MPRQLKIEGPAEVKKDEENSFICTSDASYPGVELRWRVDGELKENIETVQTENEDKTIRSISSLTHTIEGSSEQITLICYVEGRALDLQKQMKITILGW